MTSLKLTAYFAERERSGSRFLADAMFDLFADRQVATSVMLRGISGFGHQRIIRTDQSLTLSEDPSVTVVAVDTEDTIAALAGNVLGLTRSGLITLERARFVGEEPPAPNGDGVKLTVYVGRNRMVDGLPAYKAVCELLHRNGFEGASAFLGVDGTAHGQRRRARFIARNTDVPMMIVAVGAPDQVSRTTAALNAMMDDPLMTLERVRLCRDTAPPELPDADEHGRPLWQKLMITTSEADRHNGLPVHRALVRRLWQSGTASGATVLRGVWGFHDGREPHGDKLFQYGRHVPVTTIVVDSPSRIAASYPIVSEITAGRGSVTAEMVPALVAVDGEGRRGSLDLADYRY